MINENEANLNMVHVAENPAFGDIITTNTFTSVLIEDELEVEYLITDDDHKVRVTFRAIKGATVAFTSPYSGFVGLGPKVENNFMKQLASSGSIEFRVISFYVC
jgi:hypothetical protein